MGRREIDGQAREGEKAGRNSSQCRKRGKNSSRAAQKFTRRRNCSRLAVSRRWSGRRGDLVSASCRNELCRIESDARLRTDGLLIAGCNGAARQLAVTREEFLPSIDVIRFLNADSDCSWHYPAASEQSSHLKLVDFCWANCRELIDRRETFASRINSERANIL